jgi:hypothetical protein
VYHELVPVRLRLLLVPLVLACGCVDAHWAQLHWPSDQPSSPRQPVLQATTIGLAVRATAIDYEPEAIVVHLDLHNEGDARLRIEPRAITLAWDELEYAVEVSDPNWIELPPETSIDLQLRYHLGRPLTGPGSRLIVRSMTRDGVPVVDLPALELPAMPANAR